MNTFNTTRLIWPLSLALLACVANANSALAQHADVLVQVVNSRLATGSADFDSNEWTLGQRVYSAEFGSIFSVNNPGFNALPLSSPSMPAGAAALPARTALGWDFLPMKIDGALQNAFYWNGAGTTEQQVSFGALPGPDYSLQLWGNQTVGVDGGPEIVTGDVIATTGSNGSLHTHRYFYLDSGNQNETSTPADGIYLVSLQMKMTGFDASQPIYLLFGTPGSTYAALQAATTWVNSRASDLAPEFSADFNGDWVVDGEDFLIWQRGLGATVASHALGDADRDGIVGPGDLAVWKEEFGLSLANFPGAFSTPPVAPAAPVAAVPEPSGAIVATLGLASFAALRSSQTRRRRAA